MRIGVDTRLWESDTMPEERDFTKQVFSRLAVQHLNHQFIFFIGSALSDLVSLPQNVTTVTIAAGPANTLLYKWWYDIKLSLALKKYKADVFTATYGWGSFITSVSQVLIIRDLSFLNKSMYSGGISNLFSKKYTAGFIKKAKAIVTLSDFVKDELVMRFKVKKEAIQTIGSGTNDFYKPLTWEEREGIKEQFAEGCEYFVFTGGLHPHANFINALKAFSIFKRWQKTNMKLLVAGKFGDAFSKDLEKFNSYKYRHDVVIKNNISEIEMASVTAASYALIFPSYYAGFATPVLAAMQCAVPVITSANSSMSEIAGDAALYADPDKPADIAEQMKIVFKDERVRNKLIDAAKLRLELFAWDITAALLWKVIEETVST